MWPIIAGFLWSLAVILLLVLIRILIKFLIKKLAGDRVAGIILNVLAWVGFIILIIGTVLMVWGSLTVVTFGEWNQPGGYEGLAGVGLLVISGILLLGLSIMAIYGIADRPRGLWISAIIFGSINGLAGLGWAYYGYMMTYVVASWSSFYFYLLALLPGALIIICGLYAMLLERKKRIINNLYISGNQV